MDMSLFPDPMSQLLAAMTLATGLTTLFMFPRVVRASSLQGVILVLIVIVTGEIAAWFFHHLWIIPAVATFPLCVALLRERMLAPWATIHGACVVQNVVMLLLVCVWLTFRAPNLLSCVVGGLVCTVQMVAALCIGASTFDILHVLGRSWFRERNQMLLAPDPAQWPSICIQIPACNEPPELLVQTIESLLLQEYPGRWMVQVIDNNTADPRVWLPVRNFCQRFRDRVQFLHLAQWPGYKAGALNEGTRRLPDWVEVVAVVDADYLVEPGFLRATARHFADPAVAFVQTSQHYRGWQGIPYFEGLNYLYEYFFALSMVSRRELNSVVCFGSMCLVRRSALEKIGGWDEESITEDVELSIRLLGCGWRGIYDHRCYGAGLMPLDFGSLKKQRFRWAFGMIQCFKKHWRLLLGFSDPSGYSLTFIQSVCFLFLCFQYLTDVLNFLFNFVIVMTVFLSSLDFPLVPPNLSVALCGPLLLLVIANARTIWALRETTRCTPAQAMGALVFSLSLSWITARGCFSACLRRKGVFWRTPKSRGRQQWQHVVLICEEEITLSLLYLGIIVLAVRHHVLQQNLSLAPLFLQACICAGAVICAFAAEGIWLLPRTFFRTYRKRGRFSPMRKTVSSVSLPGSRTAALHQTMLQMSDQGTRSRSAVKGVVSKHLTSPVAQRRYIQRLRKLTYCQLPEDIITDSEIIAAPSRKNEWSAYGYENSPPLWWTISCGAGRACATSPTSGDEIRAPARYRYAKSSSHEDRARAEACPALSLRGSLAALHKGEASPVAHQRSGQA